MTTDQSFQKMLSNLNPTEKQKLRIQTTRDTIDTVLQSDQRIHLVPNKQISFFTGSYKRDTIIRPIDDIDLYVRIHYGLHAEGKRPLGILRLMSNALRVRYPQTKIRVDSPCIVIKFLDYKFEVVPVVSFKDDDDLYRIPGPHSREWIYCYPNIPNKWLTNSNHYNNQKFVPLIKILKQWNRINKVGLKSFHLELLTGMVFNNVSEITSYPQGIYDWMYFVSDWIHGNNSPFVLEPGKGTYVDKYLYDNKFRLKVVRKKLEIGLWKAALAYDAWLEGKEARAKRLWHQMFGDMFPAPITMAAKARLASPKPIPGPAIPLKSLFPPPKPSFLEMALRSPERNKLVTSLQQLSEIKPPEPRVNALIDLLSGYKDPFRK